MSKPFVLISGCTDLHACSPTQLIKDILKTENLPSEVSLSKDVLGYEWQVETKYYSAEVLLAIAQSPCIENKEFAECTEALVLTFNPNQVDSFKKVESWQSFVNELQPTVKLLVCDNCTESTELNRSKVLEWCIENEYELIELSPHQDYYDEGDVVGIRRLAQALQAHSWPNLVMKDEPEIHGPLMRQMMMELTEEKNKEAKISMTEDNSSHPANGHVEQSEECSEKSSEASDVVSQANSTHRAERDEAASNACVDRLAQTTGGLSILDSDIMESFEDSTDFEKMFSQMAKMKEQAAGLEPDERKQFAEKVTLAFWRAIGGDPSEIDGLSDSD